MPIPAHVECDSNFNPIEKSTLLGVLTIYLSGPIAQSVEQLAFNQWVAGSSPARLTTTIKRIGRVSLIALFERVIQSVDISVPMLRLLDVVSKQIIRFIRIDSHLTLKVDVVRIWSCNLPCVLAY